MSNILKQYRVAGEDNGLCVHDDNELYTGNHGKGCASDEYVLCRYPVKNYSRIYCIIFDSISNSEHC